jgi:hypothetical protein
MSRHPMPSNGIQWHCVAFCPFVSLSPEGICGNTLPKVWVTARNVITSGGRT